MEGSAKWRKAQVHESMTYDFSKIAWFCGKKQELYSPLWTRQRWPISIPFKSFQSQTMKCLGEKFPSRAKLDGEMLLGKAWKQCFDLESIKRD